MAIRLSQSCTNCAALSDSMMCNIHKVKVSDRYTCDQFTKSVDFNAERDCTTCSRHGQESCAHPDKAAEGMLCTSWSPITDD